MLRAIPEQWRHAPAMTVETASVTGVLRARDPDRAERAELVPIDRAERAELVPIAAQTAACTSDLSLADALAHARGHRYVSTGAVSGCYRFGPCGAGRACFCGGATADRCPWLLCGACCIGGVLPCGACWLRCETLAQYNFFIGGGRGEHWLVPIEDNGDHLLCYHACCLERPLFEYERVRRSARSARARIAQSTADDPGGAPHVPEVYWSAQ